MTTLEPIQEPATSTLPRAPRSARRTSHVDMVFVDGGGLDLRSTCRDLVTDATGAARVAGTAEVTAGLGADRLLSRLDATPAADVGGLLGRPVAGGFRAAVDAAVPADRDARTPLYLLLDELPVAALISGYAMLYLRSGEPAEAPAGPRPAAERSAAHSKNDLCAGWRSDGTMMVAIREKGGFPAPVGPPAPQIDPDDDLAWHAIGPLGPGDMRRRRLVDVTVGDEVTVYAMFRDSHVDPDGNETVLHEYHVDGTLDTATLTFERCEATPHVLPWIECPGAVASARRLEGHRASEVRDLVRRDFRGITTCTHLNDLLRSLADVPALVGLL